MADEISLELRMNLVFGFGPAEQIRGITARGAPLCFVSPYPWHQLHLFTSLSSLPGPQRHPIDLAKSAPEQASQSDCE